MDHYLSSVTNSCRLLKLFLDSPKELGVTELSKKLELTKGAVHKLLATLEHEGFIRQNPSSKQYSLGFALVELGNKVLKNHNLVDYAHPHLQKLADTTKELVCLCIRDQMEAIYVDKIDSQHPIRFNVEAYRRFPLYATSAARAILAYQGEEMIDRVLSQEMRAFTPYTVTDPDQMKGRLVRIRETGYEFSSNMRNVGVTGIAAPIMDATGQVNASVSLIGPTDRVAAQVDHFIPMVKETTSRLSAGLGYRV